MKKLLQIMTAAVLSVSFIGTVAGAQQAEGNTCDNIVIINSGENSTNSVTCEVNVAVHVTCNGSIYVIDANSQSAISGAAGVDSTGSAISGPATNENNQTVQIGSSCGTATGTTTTPSPSPSITPAPVKPTKLPYTAGASSESVIIASLVAAAFIVAISRLAVAAYRRASIK